MARTTHDALWFPYAQMRTMPPPLEVVRGEGVELILADGRRLIDATASWWCVIHGYNHPDLTAAAKGQLDQLPHVMLGGLVHPPAARLAQKLVEITPGPLQHVFFGDSGSVGVEIALKMAVQYWLNRGIAGKSRILALEKAYHGDTCGAMSVCDPAEGIHHRFAGIVPRQFFLPAPTGGFGAGDADVQHDLDLLDDMLGGHGGEIAAMIVEPLMQLAGGFCFHSPRYLQGVRELCDRHDVLLIFDEVATGFGRSGATFAAERAQVCPDIMVLGKGLTAGYAGHSATLATDRVYDAFLGADPNLAFMHGPTYMGNPTVCAVALAGIEVFFRDQYVQKARAIEARLQRDLLPLRSARVADVRVLGACGVVEVHDPASLEGLQAFAIERGVWLRPFGRWAYTMPAYIISPAQLGRITDVLVEWFT